MSEYQIRLAQRSRSQKDKAGKVKGQPGVVWFATVTHPDWIGGVDGVGASVLIHPADSPEWVQSKRENLRNSLLAHAADNRLDTIGLSDALDVALREVTSTNG
jgi:hypothetical protein